MFVRDWHPLGWHPPMPPMFDGGGKGYGGDYGMGPVGDYGAGFQGYPFDYGPSVVDASDFGYPGDGYLPPEIGDTGGVPEPFRGGYGPSREEFAPAPEPRDPGPPTSTDAIVDEGKHETEGFSSSSTLAPESSSETSQTSTHQPSLPHSTHYNFYQSHLYFQ